MTEKTKEELWIFLRGVQFGVQIVALIALLILIFR